MKSGARPVSATTFGRRIQLPATLERFLLVGLMFTAGTGGVLAQTPLGEDFQINESRIGHHLEPKVSARGGRFSVVWNELVADPDLTGIPAIRMRDYSARGVPLSAEIVVTGPGETDRGESAVAIAPNGSKLVVWTQAAPEGQAPFDVFGTLYDSAGEAIFAQRRLNTYEPGNQFPQGVAADGNSNFIVAWGSDPGDLVPSQDGSGQSVITRRLSSSGEFRGPEHLVNTFTHGDQSPGSVAAAADGKFVVVWNSAGQDGPGIGVYGQLFSAKGKPIGPEFRVNQHTTRNQLFADVAMDRWGNFVVVWQSEEEDGFVAAHLRRYRSDGKPRGGEQRVGSTRLALQFTPRIAMDSRGNFVVVWGGHDIMARAFWANGNPAGGEVVVDSTGLGGEEPDVALSDKGTMLVVWQDFGDGTTNIDTFQVSGRLFATPFPVR